MVKSIYSVRTPGIIHAHHPTWYSNTKKILLMGNQNINHYFSMFINKVEFYKTMPVFQIRNGFVIQTIINEMNKKFPFSPD